MKLSIRLALSSIRRPFGAIRSIGTLATLVATLTALSACSAPVTVPDAADVLSTDTSRDVFDSSVDAVDAADAQTDTNDAVAIDIVADAGDASTDASDASCSDGMMCGTTCVDTRSDPQHCGGCAVVCPGADDECQARTCASSACGHAFTAAGVHVAAQSAGDCHANQCDGSGTVIAATDDTDVPMDGNDCTLDLCSAGVASNPPAGAGTPCTLGGGHVCDGSSHCVECVVAADCSTSNCVAYHCVAASCSDGIRNGSETDVDCGGLCPACGNGHQCLGGADCTSRVCSANTCRTPTCTDGVRNGSESDVDCGGLCAACGLGRMCAGGSDCLSNNCLAGTCH